MNTVRFHHLIALLTWINVAKILIFYYDWNDSRIYLIESKRPDNPFRLDAKRYCLDVKWGDVVNSNDNRHASRRKTLFGGECYGPEKQTWDCRVIDMSETGARLKSSAKFTVGSKIFLRIFNLKGILQCEIQWVRDDLIGVSFLKSSGVNDLEFYKTFNILHTLDDMDENRKARIARVRAALIPKTDAPIKPSYSA